MSLATKFQLSILFILAGIECCAVDLPLQKPYFSGYHLTISDSHKFVWFRNAKVCTRTIYHLLNTEYSINGGHIKFDPRKYKKYFKFAFVRNPWDRVVSCYFNKVVTKSHPPFAICYGKSFEEFVYFINSCDLTQVDIHIQLQTKLIPLEHVDFVGRMERFSKDIKYVLKRIGMNCGEIQRYNASKHEHYSQYYNNITRRIIADKYKADIEAFGYQFEDL
jgi:hypothetical protein